MNRFNPGVYSLQNTTTGDLKEFIMDNVRYELPRNSQLTVNVKINLLVSATEMSANNIWVNKVGDGYYAVVGNTSHHE